MSLFYTDVAVQGSNILLRQVKDGIRSNVKIPWQPTLYIRDNSGNSEEFVSLYGDKVKPVQPGSIRDCKDFAKQYEGVQGFEIYGQLNYALQYMSQFPMQGNWNFKQIRCFSIDIETKMPPGGGFPKPEHALGEINLITLQDIHTKRCFTFGTIPKPEKCDYTNYTHCIDEKQLLRMFLQFWEQVMPDVITGWNINQFDIPYIINRMQQILGEEATKKLSPWGLVDFGTKEYRGKIEVTAKIVGIQILDYMELMKKFTYGNRESWKLDAVAQEELGEAKLENPANTFKEFYELFPDTFVEYNVHDAVLITKMDDKMKLLELAMTIAYMARVNYVDVYSPVKTWDNIIHNKLLADNIVVPQRKATGFNMRGEGIEGAYVKDPKHGMYTDVASIDATSLYPSLMITLNLSPETYLGQCHSTVEMCLSGNYTNKDPNITMGANGSMFRKDKQGVIPSLITNYMALRKTTKAEMLALEQQAENFKKEGDKKSAEDLRNQISSRSNLEKALKILQNALYGALANAGFRFFNADVAESITLTGQLYLRAIERDIDAKLSKIFNMKPTVFCVYEDTDSCYFTLKDVIDKYAPGASIEQRIKMVEKLTAEKIVPAVNEIGLAVSQGLNVYAHKIVFKTEIAADKAMWIGKKMYICRVFSSEGVRYAKPKYKTMGISLVRSSTPKVVKKVLKDSLDVIFNEGETATQEYINKARAEFMKNSIEDVAFPRGANNLEEYASGSDIFRKGTPIHVRATLLHNHYVEKLGLQDKYEKIAEGNKIKFIYLKMPNPIQQNIIAWSVDGKLPTEFGLHKYVDWDMQFDKTVKDSMENLMTPIGWSVEQRNNLEDFFN